MLRSVNDHARAEGDSGTQHQDAQADHEEVLEREPMVITVLSCAEDEVDDLYSYQINGVEKTIGWHALSRLVTQFCSESDQDHTPEEHLLASLVTKFWSTSPDWWRGASMGEAEASEEFVVSAPARGPTLR